MPRCEQLDLIHLKEHFWAADEPIHWIAMEFFKMMHKFMSYVVALTIGLTSSASGQEATIFVADTMTYRLYISEIPCGAATQRQLSFRAEFRDPVLARDPDIIARAALVGAIALRRWPTRVTCIDTNNFLGRVTSYYEGNLMYRGRTHVTQNLREYELQSGERFGGLVRGTTFSLVLRDFAQGAFRPSNNAPLDTPAFFDALEKAASTPSETAAMDYIRASLMDRENDPFFPNARPASVEIIDGLERASQQGVEAATLHLLRRAGVDTIVRQIRGRAIEGNAGVTDEEMEILNESRGLIETAISQEIGLVLFLMSELDKVGVSIDPSMPSTNDNSLPVAFEIGQCRAASIWYGLLMR